MLWLCKSVVCVTSGVPVVVDFAAMREAVKRLGGDPMKINPICPTDLVIDHSVQVDVSRRSGFVCVCLFLLLFSFQPRVKHHLSLGNVSVCSAVRM